MIEFRKRDVDWDSRRAGSPVLREKHLLKILHGVRRESEDPPEPLELPGVLTEPRGECSELSQSNGAYAAPRDHGASE